MNSMSGFFRFLATTRVLCVASLLAFSLVLHSVQFEHDHPGTAAGFQSNDAGHAHGHAGHGENVFGLGEYMHGSEKKLFLFLLIPVLLLDIVRRILFGSWQMFLYNLERRYLLLHTHKKRIPLRIYSVLQYCFSRGMLHPKTY